jgi:hypothetical protein
MEENSINSRFSQVPMPAPDKIAGASANASPDKSPGKMATETYDQETIFDVAMDLLNFQRGSGTRNLQAPDGAESASKRRKISDEDMEVRDLISSAEFSPKKRSMCFFCFSCFQFFKAPSRELPLPTFILWRLIHQRFFFKNLSGFSIISKFGAHH